MDENNHILAGKPAVSQRTSHPDKTVALSKRTMGSNTSWRLGSDTFNAPELSSLVLRSLKEDAEEFLQRPTRDAVISVPIYFSDERRKYTRLAAELAGLNTVHSINEPTAAAMAYGLHTQRDTRSLMLDPGDSTFDVAVLEYVTPVIEVHASASDNFLGGEGLTHMLVDDILECADVTRTMFNEGKPVALYACVKAAKCSNQSPLHIRQQYQDETRGCEFYESELEDLWSPLLNHLRVPIEQALRDARLKPSQIDSLVLAGGTPQMPLMRRTAVRLFGKLSYQSHDSSTTVALGAAIQAAYRLHSGDIEKVILTDICPYSLGIEVDHQSVSGIFSPIVERNTTMPMSCVETYSTMCPEQDSTTVNVYQGENHEIKNNILVESFDVPLKRTGAYQSIDIRFSYGINGSFEVDVLLEDDSIKSRVINHSLVTLSAQQVEESRTRLSALKIHPCDMLINRTFKAKLEELRAQALGDEREEIGRVITDLGAVLQSNDTARVDEVRRRASVYLAIETS